MHNDQFYGINYNKNLFLNEVTSTNERVSLLKMRICREISFLTNQVERKQAIRLKPNSGNLGETFRVKNKSNTK